VGGEDMTRRVGIVPFTPEALAKRAQIVAVSGFRQRWRLPRRPIVDH
jgi:hypothetical protein